MAGSSEVIIENHKNLDDIISLLKHHGINAAFILDSLVNALEEYERINERDEKMEELIGDLKEYKQNRLTETVDTVPLEEEATISTIQSNSEPMEEQRPKVVEDLDLDNLEDLDLIDDNFQNFFLSDQKGQDKPTNKRKQKIYAIQYYGKSTYHIMDEDGKAICGVHGTLPQKVIVPKKQINCGRCESWMARSDVMQYVDA